MTAADGSTYRIEITPIALKMLTAVNDRREQQILTERIDQLRQYPEQQGKPLSNELRGYRSIRAVGQRYRIVYRVDLDRVLVLVVGVGRRRAGDKRDIYAVLQRLLEDLED